MKQRLSRRDYARAATLLALVASLAFAAVAMGGPARDAKVPGAELPTATTVFISAQGGLHFVAPKTIESGQELTVINQTNPKQVFLAHLLVGYQGLAPENQEGTADLLHAETHLQGDRLLARRQRQRAGEKEPCPPPEPKVGTRWAA